MAGDQRRFKQKIQATSTLEKVFRAMELIASSRIGRARRAAQGADPYTRAITSALSLVAHRDFDASHPLLRERSDSGRVAILVVTSDRGLAGSYSANVEREAVEVMNRLRGEGKEPVLFVTGRRGIAYFKFRDAVIERSWEGGSDQPAEERMDEVAQALVDAFLTPGKQGVDQVLVISTRFKSMVKQTVEVRHMLPLAVVEAESGPLLDDEEALFTPGTGDALPLYEFEPSAHEVFGALLPLYVKQRIANVLLMAAASELAARQQAMHSATDNAHQLVDEYTRRANEARQAEITTEITEIVSGADALKNS